MRKWSISRGTTRESLNPCRALWTLKSGAGMMPWESRRRWRETLMRWRFSWATPIAKLLRPRNSSGTFRDNSRYMTSLWLWGALICLYNLTYAKDQQKAHQKLTVMLLLCSGCPTAPWWCSERTGRHEGAGGNGGAQKHSDASWDWGAESCSGADRERPQSGWTRAGGCQWACWAAALSG